MYYFLGENDKFSINKLKEDVRKVRIKFPNKIPVIVTKNKKTTDLPNIDGKKFRKFLVPDDLTVGQFVYTVRKRVKLPSEKAMFIFVNYNGSYSIPPTAMLMSELYKKYKSDCGFLLMEYSGENTFGL